MRKVLTSAAVMCLFAIQCVSAHGEDAAAKCASGLEPGKYPFKGSEAASKQGGNIGIAPNGFVGIRNAAVTHGIDVSKWQDATDFVNLKKCGGAFVYVRLSVGEDTDKELQYKTHWANARGVSLLVGPYHYLTLADSATPAAALPSAQLAALASQNVSSARVQANSFISRLGYLLLKDPIVGNPANRLGQPYLPVVLDLTERPQSRFGDADRAAIGKVYGEAACAWISTLRAFPSFSNQQVMIFTDAAIFHDYRLEDAPCDLRGKMVWISNHTPDGSRYAGLESPETKSAYHDLCVAPDGRDRCLLQQYTSYGGFAVYRSGAPLDLDRFFGDVGALQAISQTALRPDLWNSDGTRK